MGFEALPRFLLQVPVDAHADIVAKPRQHDVASARMAVVQREFWFLGLDFDRDANRLGRFHGRFVRVFRVDVRQGGGADGAERA